MKRRSIFLVLLLILCFASIGLSQQTGTFKGTITDDNNNPLPGVTATLSSSAMQGTSSYISNETGGFRFPSLRPGMYALRIELAGFQTVERTGIQVRVGATTTVDVQLIPSTLEEEITVTAPSPVVDVEASNITVTMSKEMITSIPLRREVLNLFESAPATVGMSSSNAYQKQASVAGGTLAESKIALDGVDLIDYDMGYTAGDITWDAIEEAEMVIGGHGAEVGQVSAGFLNVVTKSGGNSFSGSITMGGTHESLTQVVIPQEQIEGFGLNRPQIKKYKADIGGSFGGPIIKDKVWFFISPRYNTFNQSTYFIPFTDPDGIFHAAYDNKHNDYLGLGKVTVQLKGNLKWFGMYQYNTAYELPEMWSVTKPYSPMESQKTYVDKVHTASSVMTYILNQNSFLEARFGMVLRTFLFDFSNEWEGPSTRAAHSDRTYRYSWGMPGGGTRYYRDNWNIGATFTRFQDNFLGGDHEFKVGAEYGHGIAKKQTPRPNPYNYYWNKWEPWYYSDQEPYKGRVRINSDVTDRFHTAGLWRMGLFLQDTINIGERLTINLGLRYDKYNGFVPEKHIEGWDDVWENGLANVLLPEIFFPAGQSLTAPPIDDILVYSMLSPRVGLSYDLFGSGKTIIRASVARYGEALYSALIAGSGLPLPRKRVTFTWWDDNHNGELDLPPVDRYKAGGYSAWDTDSAKLRTGFASDLMAPYTDELLLGITQELSQDVSLSLNYMNKRSKRMFGERNLNIGKDSEWWVPYSVTDPGDDGMLNTGNEQNLTVYMLRSDAPSNFYQVDNMDDFWRKYWGFTVMLHKRMSNGWMLNGSIAYSKSTGNYPHGYFNSGATMPNYDPNDDINRAGRLEYDRPLIVKLMSSVNLPLDFTLSGYFKYFSGGHFTRQVTVYFPSTVMGYTPKSDEVTVNAEPEGHRNSAPEAFLDLRLEKSFDMGRFNVGVWVEVFNLFGHWNFAWNQTRLVGGEIEADGSFARYPGYGKPDAVFGAREFSLGARIRF